MKTMNFLLTGLPAMLWALKAFYFLLIKLVVGAKGVSAAMMLPPLMSLNPKSQAIAGASGKQIINTPATALQADNTKPVITVPGEGHLQVQPNGDLAHVVMGGLQPASKKSVPFIGGPVQHKYTVKVKRTGAHFGGLGYVIGMSDEQGINFSSVISQVASATTAGLTLTTTFDSTGNLIFTYTDGANTDTLKVSCAQMPYYNFLQKLKVKRYVNITTRMSFSDTATAEDQYSSSIIKAHRKESGGLEIDPMDYLAEQTPYQLNTIKVDVTDDYYLSRTEGMASSIIEEDGVTLSHSLMVSNAEPLAING